VHFLRFELSDGMIGDWRNGAAQKLASAHPLMCEEVSLSKTLRKALAEDFA
jgi:hypothetical protein